MPGRRLTRDERIRIETLWGQGLTMPKIAEVLGRDRTTIWREVNRYHSSRHGVKHPGGARGGRPGLGGVYRWGYVACWAQRRADAQARRPRLAVCAKGGRLRETVLGMLEDRCSPQQIAGRLRLLFPGQPEMQVSHETIYQAVYVQSRGGLREVLTRQIALRSGRAQRRRASTAAGALRSARPWTVDLNISSRPAEAADRAVPGHWEGDLLVGKDGSSAIITLVERSTRFVLLGALPDGRASQAVVSVLSELIQRLPAELRRSVTWDCGSELARHADFTVAAGCPVYFCDPHSPWQRGSNENSNGLLRQYFPKGHTDFRTIPQADLDQVAAQLNRRPRRTLDFYTPTEKLNALLVATTA